MTSGAECQDSSPEWAGIYVNLIRMMAARHYPVDGIVALPTGPGPSHAGVVVEGSSSLVQEAMMYLVIRKFNYISSMAEAARRAESSLGRLLKQSPGFQGYYVFDAGHGIGGSVSLFEGKEAALAANGSVALTWKGHDEPSRNGLLRRQDRRAGSQDGFGLSHRAEAGCSGHDGSCA